MVLVQEEIIRVPLIQEAYASMAAMQVVLAFMAILANQAFKAVIDFSSSPLHLQFPLSVSSAIISSGLICPYF